MSLHQSGRPVVTISSSAPVRELLQLLAEHRIGCAVVSDDGSSIAGIVSERDVVRRLVDAGAGLLDASVDSIMTTDVLVTGPDADVETLMRLMTEHRIRHVPIVDEGRLVGLVSIGDVVKERIGVLEDERNALVTYITQGG